MNSDTKLNYFVRPAKCAERRMICHTLQRLSSFSSLENYQYIGLGAYFFYDFILFHKELNIQVMHSIQSVKQAEYDNDGTCIFISDPKKENENMKRYNSNKPYDCIKMHFDVTSNVLPNLDFQKRSIIWLDYDDKFNSIIVDDINFITPQISSGSVFFITCDAKLQAPCGPAGMFSDFSKKVGYDLVSAAGVTEKTFSSKNGYVLASKLVFDNLIDRSINMRNRAVKEDEKINYEQLYYFSYKDGALMVTIGGIFFSNKETINYKNCNFEHFNFVVSPKKTSKPFNIEVPNLTIKEIKELNMLMPQLSKTFDSEKKFGISKKDFVSFSKIYRYIPAYSEFFI